MLSYPEVTVALNIIHKTPHDFAVGEFLSLTDPDTDSAKRQEIFRPGPRCILLGKEETGEEYYIGEEALFRWFSTLSLELAARRESRVSAWQLKMLASSIHPNGKWSVFPDEAFRFGQQFGFLGRPYRSGQFVFPLAHLMSYLSPSSLQIARNTLDNMAKAPKSRQYLEALLQKSVKEGLANFDQRVVDIIQLRQGISDGTKYTLEQIGSGFGITRERVRQLEAKFWNSIHNPLLAEQCLSPFIVSMICDVLRNSGSLILQTDSLGTNLRKFIVRCVGVPEVAIQDTETVILGALPRHLVIPKATVSFDNKIDRHYMANQLESNEQLCLIENDLKLIAESIVCFHRKRLTKSQKIYLVLRAIGEPAHYSKITSIYNSMFPQDYLTESNAHSILSGQKHGIVWIGLHGTFALKEWGYERPKKKLFDAVTEIVNDNFRKTQKPVELETIRAEIGKYRTVVNKASINAVAYCNKNIQRVSKNSFVPKN